MGSYKTYGIILRRNDYGEADRIYTILTPERKVSAIAKGVRKSTAKLASHLELFTEIELMLAEGRNLDVITSARVGRQFDPTGDYDYLRRGFLYLEMTDKLTDTENVSGIYGLLRQAIDSLEGGSGVLGELSFKLRLLDELGHAPDLSATDLNSDNPGLDIEHGALVASGSSSSLSIDKDSVKLWRLLMKKPLPEVERVNGAMEAAERSISICDRFIERQFGVRFKASEM